VGVAVSVDGVVTILLPGTGSDDDYLRRALAASLEQAGAVVLTVAPRPDRLVDGYLEALDRIWSARAQDGRIAVGGVSLGAVLATRWALAHPERTVAVLAVLPPWTGEPDDAPAAVSARHTAAALRRDGLAATTAAMRASSPGWLADELGRSWARQWPALPDAMEQAASCVAPSRTELNRLPVPLAVVGADDDPVHPAAVARDWASWAPHAALRTVRLEEFGPHPALLGRACVEALCAIG
jgi:pimeloyl-ACP methyl ester carboxylesterase